MRRLWLFLLVALLLVGCGRRQPQPEATESTPPAEETQGLYVPDSPVEQQTGGAVRPYSLRADTYFDLAGMGANLLVMGQKGLMVISNQIDATIATCFCSLRCESHFFNEHLTNIFKFNSAKFIDIKADGFRKCFSLFSFLFFCCNFLHHFLHFNITV